MNAEDISQSQIIFPSKVKDHIDSYTVDRLISENRDFSEFIVDIIENDQINRFKSGSFDTVMDPTEISEYVSI